jgi:hypothetical protein
MAIEPLFPIPLAVIERPGWHLQIGATVRHIFPLEQDAGATFALLFAVLDGCDALLPAQGSDRDLFWLAASWRQNGQSILGALAWEEHRKVQVEGFVDAIAVDR